MKLYEVSYWEEGPGISHIERVLVLSFNKTSAIKYVIKKCGVYKADRDTVYAKQVPSREMIFEMIVKHLD